MHVLFNILFSYTDISTTVIRQAYPLTMPLQSRHVELSPLQIPHASFPVDPSDTH